MSSAVSAAASYFPNHSGFIFFSLIFHCIPAHRHYHYIQKKLRKTTRLFLTTSVVIPVIMRAIFEIFPRESISIFGTAGNDTLYYEFGFKFMRYFLFFVFLNGIQICASTFCPSIGKGGIGASLSFSKQIVFLFPLLLILPKFLGLNGLLLAEPVADLLAFAVAVFFLIREFREMPKDDVVAEGE